jgi:hypothetical protein
MPTLSFLNFWPQNNEIQDIWFLHFFQATKVLPHQNPDILICSVFGSYSAIQQTKANFKIFFTGEHLDRYPPYNNLTLLKTHVDLIIGFHPTQLEQKQLRFPLWLLYFPFYSIKEPNLLTYLQEQYQRNLPKQNVAACIARHDRDGIRSYLCDSVRQYIPVLCPGKFQNNCKQIGPYTKDKLTFLQTVKFNICPENTKAKGYCTEKVFQALEAGCIPIYSGYEYPEPSLLHPDAVCFVQTFDKSILERKKTQTIFTANAPFILEHMYTTLRRSVLRFSEQIYGISYASRQFQTRETIITNQGKKCPFFQHFHCWTEKDISDDFKIKFAPIWNDSTRGGGWWIWKPYIVYETLKTMNDGDILVYLDGGCTINVTEQSKQRFQEYVYAVKNHWSGFLRFALEHQEKKYTNKHMCSYMKSRYNLTDKQLTTYIESPQLVGGIFILCKNTFTLSFFEECLKIIEDDPFLLNEKYTLPNEKHRHDQSLLSMLYKVKNVDCILKDETWSDKGFQKQYPFWATRHR